MNKIIYSMLFSAFLFSNSLNAQILKKTKIVQKVVQATTSSTALTENEIVEGLKEALSKGSTKAADSLHKTNGFNLNPKVRIPFPEDCKKAADKLRAMGYGKKVDEFELKLNRSAEEAAKESAPIFINSIKQMSISDAKGILKGSDTAATSYLKKSTYDSLYKAFSPHIKTALDQTTTTHLWTEIATIYNKLPTTKNKIQTDLVAYTTHKALKGVFTLVADEELKIRKDPMARTTDILKKVFGNKN